MSRKLIRGLAAVLPLILAAASPAGGASAPRLVIRVKAGPQYYRKTWYRSWQLDVLPQMAIWLADEDGKHVETIYVTYRSATANWIGGRHLRRPAALPIWSHARGVKYADGLHMPTRENPLPDALTGPTPQESFTREWTVPPALPPGRYLIRVEVNSAFDYNERYREGLPESDPGRSEDESAQPSVLWEGKLELGRGPATIPLRRVGHGDPTGRSGRIWPDLSGLTSALKIVEAIEVQIP